MRPPRLRSVALVLLGLAVAAGAAIAAFAGAGRWLDNPDAPAKADAILVLSGSHFRTLHAAELYRQGLAPVVYISAPVPDPSAAPLAALGVRLVPMEAITEDILRAKGVPPDRIRRLERTVVSTVDEAAELRRALAGRTAKVLVVTSPYHVRRSRMVFEDALRGTGIAVAVLATPLEPLPERWWSTQSSARDVLLEWVKIAFFLGGGSFRAQP